MLMKPSHIYAFLWRASLLALEREAVHGDFQ
jgi:hypothetical protein